MSDPAPPSTPDTGLPPDEIHVWLMAEPEDTPACLRRVLSDAERGELGRMAEEPGRRFACGRGLLRHVLACYGGRGPEAWTLRRDARGRPELAQADAPAFNVSHTDGLVACAVGRGAVGVDVEGGRRLRDPRALAGRFFHPDEARRVGEPSDDALARERFLRLWCLKEALAKAEGGGLAGLLGRVHFPPGDAEAREAGTPSPVAPGGAGPGWRCWHGRPTPRHHLAVAATGAERLVCRWVPGGEPRP